MPQAARWVGTPSIKGRNESARMALLTFSLLGLQCVFCHLGCLDGVLVCQGNEADSIATDLPGVLR